MKFTFFILSLAVFSSFALSEDLTLLDALEQNILPFTDENVLLLAKQYNAKITLEHPKYSIFKENLQKIRTHNLKKSTYKLSIDGPYAFVSDEEFLSNQLGSIDCSDMLTESNFNPVKSMKNQEIPSHINWTALNKVSAVKDQQNCGSCWAFAATGAIESQYAIYEGVEAPSLSEQQLLDCSSSFGNDGCTNGLSQNAFEYIIAAGGVAFENSYYYEAMPQECQFQPDTVGARITGYENIASGNEHDLKIAVATIGPIASGIEVFPDYRFYKSGIYFNPECEGTAESVNHAVLITGYGVEDGIDIWYVKNSWSQYWGEEGYFRIVRGDNMCGIASCASYPILEEKDNASSSLFKSSGIII